MRIRSDFVAAFLAAGIPGSHVVSLQHVEPRVLLKLLALISSTRWKGQFSSTSLLHTIGGNIIRNCMFKSITYLFDMYVVYCLVYTQILRYLHLNPYALGHNDPLQVKGSWSLEVAAGPSKRSDVLNLQWCQTQHCDGVRQGCMMLQMLKCWDLIVSQLWVSLFDELDNVLKGTNEVGSKI